jgi:hypothetical protein
MRHFWGLPARHWRGFIGHGGVSRKEGLRSRDILGGNVTGNGNTDNRPATDELFYLYTLAQNELGELVTFLLGDLSAAINASSVPVKADLTTPL